MSDYVATGHRWAEANSQAVRGNDCHAPSPRDFCHCGEGNWVRTVLRDIGLQEFGILTGILAAVDLSQFAYAVTMRAIQLASLQQSDLTLISVVKPGLGVRNMMIGEEGQLASFHRELIYKCVPKGGVTVVSSGYGGTGAVYKSASGTIIHTLVDHGDPVERICATAEKMKADLVVVGNRGLGAAGTFILGSVSQKVVQKCSRPVLVVKEPSSDPADWQRLAELDRARHGLGSR